MDKISGIYKITNIINGKIYVGQSLDLKARFADHKRRLKNKKHDNNYLQNSWNKYGEENFTFSIIEILPKSIECLNEKEIYWMHKLDVLNRKFGFNISSGGGNAYSLTGKSQEEKKEIYKKITEARLKKWSAKGSPRRGCKITDEQKKYLSFINIGEKHPMFGTKRPLHSQLMMGSKNPRAKKVICITTGEEFATAKEAGQKYNTTNSNILKCCKEKQNTAGKLKNGIKLKWKYA